MEDLVEKLHINAEKKKAVGIEDEITEIGDDLHIYEMCIVGLNVIERQQFYQELVKESLFLDTNEANYGTKGSILNQLCYSAMQMLVRGMSVDISATYRDLLTSDTGDLTPIISILSAFAYIVSGLWIPQEGQVMTSFPRWIKEELNNNHHAQQLQAGRKSDEIQEKMKIIYERKSIKWTVSLLSDCILDHDDLLMNLLGLIDKDKQEIIPVLVFYIFSKQNILSWIEPFYELFLYKALYSLSIYTPPIAIVNKYPRNVARQCSSNIVKILWETHVYSAIAKYFELNVISEEIDSFGIQEFLRKLVEKIIEMVPSTEEIPQEKSEGTLMSELRDAMIRVVFAVPRSYLWICLNFILTDISKISKRLSDLLSTKPSSMQIHEVAAVWNTILFILSLLSSSSSKDQNIKNDLTDVTWKSSQLYLSEFEKKKKLMIMRAPSIDPLQAILLHDTSLRGEVGEFHATNKIKFFELVTPKQGVGMLALPLQNLLRNSRLAASLCYSNLISVLRKFEMWHVPSGGLKLVLRCLHHLLLNVPVGLMSDQAASSTILAQRSEYLKSFAISSNALFQLLETTHSETWKDMKSISVSVGQPSRASSSNNSTINLPTLHSRLTDTVYEFSEVLGKCKKNGSAFELSLMLERLYAVARSWRTIASLDAAEKGLISAKQYSSMLNQHQHYTNWNYCRVLSSGNTILDLSELRFLPGLVENLNRITDWKSRTTYPLEYPLRSHIFDQGLFSFKNIFDKVQEFPEINTGPATDIEKLKSLANCFSACCDFIYGTSCTSETTGGFCNFDEENVLTHHVGFILSSLRIAWQYCVYSLAFSLFCHVASGKGPRNGSDHEEKFNTPNNIYMTTQLEYGHSLRNMFPSPLRTFAYPSSSQSKYGSQDNHVSEQHSVIEQLIICSSFPPAIEVTQDLLQIMHHVMEHLSMSLLRLSPKSIIFQEILRTQSFILESLWWFLHRTTGFSLEIAVITPLKFCSSEIASTLELIAEKSSKNISTLFERIKSLAQHLQSFLPMTGSDSETDPHHAANYLMLWTMLHFSFYDQYQHHDKNSNVLFVAMSCCINGLTESAMLPSLCSLLPPVVAHNHGCNTVATTTPPRQHRCDSHSLIFIAYFLKLVVGKLSQMTSPSPSEQLEEELMTTMADGLRVMMSIPLLLISVYEYRLPIYNDTNSLQIQLPSEASAEDVLYNCIRSCMGKIEVMLSLWIDLEQICETCHYHHCSNPVLKYYGLLGVDEGPIQIAYDLKPFHKESMIVSSSTALASRVNILACLAKKMSEIFHNKASSREETSLQPDQLYPTKSSIPMTLSICELWIKQLIRQSLALAVCVLLQFVISSHLGTALSRDKILISDFLSLMKVITAFASPVLSAMTWLPSMSMETILTSPTRSNTEYKLVFNALTILSGVKWLYNWLLSHCPQQKSILLLATSNSSFMDWCSENLSEQTSDCYPGRCRFWLEFIDQMVSHGDSEGVDWRQVVQNAVQMSSSIDESKEEVGKEDKSRGGAESIAEADALLLASADEEDGCITGIRMEVAMAMEDEVSNGIVAQEAENDHCIENKKRKFEDLEEMPIKNSTNSSCEDIVCVGDVNETLVGTSMVEQYPPISNPQPTDPITPTKLDGVQETFLAGSATQTPVAAGTSSLGMKAPFRAFEPLPTDQLLKEDFNQAMSSSAKRIRQGFAPITYTSLDRENLLEYTQEASQDFSQPLLTLQGLAPKSIPTSAQKVPRAANPQHLVENHISAGLSKPELTIPSLEPQQQLPMMQREKTTTNQSNSELDAAWISLQSSMDEYMKNKNTPSLWRSLQSCQELSSSIIGILKSEADHYQTISK